VDPKDSSNRPTQPAYMMATKCDKLKWQLKFQQYDEYADTISCTAIFVYKLETEDGGPLPEVDKVKRITQLAIFIFPVISLALCSIFISPFVLLDLENIGTFRHFLVT